VIPAPAAERIAALDALRALALLGVALINVLALAGTEWLIAQPFSEAAEPWTLRAVTLLVYGKAYVLFAFLFGVGFALQADRLEARGAPAERVLKRRYVALAGFGVAHALLVWSGDVLLTYALLGLILLRFRGCEQPGVLRAAVLLLLANAALYSAVAYFADQHSELIGEVLSEEADDAAERQAAYGEGTFGDIFARRAWDALGQLGANAEIGLQMLAMFLLGSWAARSGVLRGEGLERRRLKVLAGLLVLAGAAGELATLRLSEDSTCEYARYLAGQAIHVLSAPALTLGAATAFFLVQPKRVTAWLAPLGRMTLTGYLLQSLIFTTLFYSYGGGLYGSVGPFEALALAATVWLFELQCARWWLARFSMGPAEALWRRLTYGRPR
jgi:uncharacterized protein